MVDPAVTFYDDLAESYHLIYPDWEHEVRRQGEVLNRLIRAQMGSGPLSILDCSAGIGTQAIGLAIFDHEVTATDISPRASERAAREAKRFGVSITFGVADFRSLSRQVAGEFDVVISCDNSLPHLLGDDELHLAAQNIRSKLREDGLFLASIRDYDEISRERPSGTIPSVSDSPGGKRIYFQVWEWADDGRTYTIHLFLITRSAGSWEVQHHETRYRAVLRAELTEILQKAGFRDVVWHMPDTSGYFQPLVVARNGPALRRAGPRR